MNDRRGRFGGECAEGLDAGGRTCETLGACAANRDAEGRALIPFFTGYAVIVWWLAGRHRRTLLGFVWVGLGAAFMAMVILGHYTLGVVTQGRIYMEVLQPILYGYGLVVTGMGVYIACLPRRVEHGPRCYACGYDVRAIRSTLCPECGTAIPARDVGAGAGVGARVGRLSADEPRGGADEQDRAGHAERERKADDAESIGIDGADHGGRSGLGASGDELVEFGEVGDRRVEEFGVARVGSDGAAVD